jgi:glycosyltransferase involved in cell wall biosynthesis
MSASSPAVSVVIRTYNRAETIERTIASAEAQDFHDMEILVIDDGSTDGTGALLRDRQGIRYHYQENQGIVGARRTGITLARGRFVALLDSDDQWDARYLSQMIDALETTGAGVAFCDLVRRTPDGEVRDGFCGTNRKLRERLLTGGVHPLSPEELREIFIESMPAPSSAMLFRKELCHCDWSVPIHVLDDWFMAMSAITTDKPAGVFVAECLVTKLILDSGVYEGRSHGAEFRKWFYRDRFLAVQTFGADLSHGERALWKKELGEVAFDLGYEAALEGRGLDAVCWYLRALMHGKTAAFAALGKLPATLTRRRKSSSTQESQT